MHKHFCVRGRNALICAVEEQEYLPAPFACASVVSTYISAEEKFEQAVFWVLQEPCAECSFGVTQCGCFTGGRASRDQGAGAYFSLLSPLYSTDLGMQTQEWWSLT